MKKKKWERFVSGLSIMRTRFTFFLWRWLDLLFHGRRPENIRGLSSNKSRIKVSVARQLVEEDGYDGMERDDKTVAELLHDINNN